MRHANEYPRYYRLGARHPRAFLHRRRTGTARGSRAVRRRPARDEISLRTPVGLACIEAVRKGLPDAVVGAGGLTRAVDFAAADRVGAQFGATPGLTPELAAASRGARFPVVPGVMTPTEVISARNSNFSVLKLFPAEQAGGVGILRTFGLAIPDVLFCAGGGVTRTNAADYLSLANVGCVAGNWVVPQALLLQSDWAGIEALARDAESLAKS
jgi:2-dehydro-3-deoxyphosphogluconate aldolase/(4S)-4-hydroxy-2-oxoglutarate aldolase